MLQLLQIHYYITITITLLLQVGNMITNGTIITNYDIFQSCKLADVQMSSTYSAASAMYTGYHDLALQAWKEAVTTHSWTDTTTAISADK